MTQVTKNFNFSGIESSLIMSGRLVSSIENFSAGNIGELVMMVEEQSTSD